MSDLEAAMERASVALVRLETAMETRERALAEARSVAQTSDDEGQELPVLRAERDHLVGEVQTLRARAQADAKLRAEAASAVRDALRDLRSAVTQGASSHA